METFSGQLWQKIRHWIVAVLITVLGYFGYKQFILDPKEKQATEAMFRAEDYFRTDSVRLALNGDAVNAGFVKIISRYKGTKAADLAEFYAGACYLKLGDFNNAVKYLKDFKTSASSGSGKSLWTSWEMHILN